jgi:hypothetical protein
MARYYGKRATAYYGQNFCPYAPAFTQVFLTAVVPGILTVGRLGKTEGETEGGGKNR